MTDKPSTLKMLDAAMQILIVLNQDAHSTEISDVLDSLSEWREQYVQDNSQFGVGA